MPNFIDMTGFTFSRLTVIKRMENDRHRKARWLCECVCGVKIIVDAGSLRSKCTSSCGCLRREIVAARKPNLKHGLRRTPEYLVWININRRCMDDKTQAFSNYGGRGISVCNEWSGVGGFENFIAAMGKRPSKHHQIDRIDNNGNYEPSNCRWATRSQNVKNRRCAAERSSESYGVSWDKKNRMWRANFTCNGKYVHVGRYLDEEQASISVTIAMEKAGMGSIDWLLEAQSSSVV